MKGLVIAGTHSGSGKTTVTLGILAALRDKGLRVQSFKAGPDFIDSGLHRLITGRASINLDLWMCGQQYVKARIAEFTEECDALVVEGVMGMYDGQSSAALLAELLGLPVVLVVDAYGMAESAGAVVKGFASYNQQAEVGGRELAECGLSFAGVIFNRVASERHYERLKESVQDMPVLGYLPRDAGLEIPHRHLGLTVAEESPLSEDMIRSLAETVLRHVDMDGLLRLERQRQRPRGKAQVKTNALPVAPGTLTLPLKLAVAYDKAFCFYYEDNFDLLRRAGAELLFFSPLSDSSLPVGADALYLGGGYPELHAAALSENRAMLQAVKSWSDSGGTTYAECGGLMYLSRGILDFDGGLHPMAGVFPFETRMKKGRTGLGYREAELKEDSPLGPKGLSFRGHEFHYSEVVDTGDLRGVGKIYSVKDSYGNRLPDEGYRLGNTIASYIHAHFGSNPEAVRSFAAFADRRGS